MSVVQRASRGALALLGLLSLMLALAVPSASAAPLPPDPDYPVGENTASAVCVGDIPYLSLAIDFGPEYAGETATWEWRDGDGVVRVTGEVTLDENGQASYSDLWPGASVDPPDWPGWVLEDGVWVEDPNEPGAWTRYPEGVVTEITFTVNPSVTVPLTYPPSSAICANPTNPGDTPVCDDNPGDGVNDDLPPCTPGGNEPVCDQTPGDGVDEDLPPCDSLPATGSNTLGTAALAGAGLLVVGAGAVAVSRRRSKGPSEG